MVPANKIGDGWEAMEGAIAYSIYRIYFTFNVVIPLGTVLPGLTLSCWLVKGLC